MGSFVPTQRQSAPERFTPWAIRRPISSRLEEQCVVFPGRGKDALLSWVLNLLKGIDILCLALGGRAKQSRDGVFHSRANQRLSLPSRHPNFGLYFGFADSRARLQCCGIRPSGATARLPPACAVQPEGVVRAGYDASRPPPGAQPVAESSAMAIAACRIPPSHRAVLAVRKLPRMVL